jgi:hypothetical protein
MKAIENGQAVELHKLSIRDRVNAVTNTLYWNPYLRVDSIIAGTGPVAGVLYPSAKEEYPIIKNNNLAEFLHIPVVPERIQPYVIAAEGIVYGLLARPYGQTIFEALRKKPTAENHETPKRRNFRNFGSTLYNKTMFPYVSQAWRTGNFQLYG